MKQTTKQNSLGRIGMVIGFFVGAMGFGYGIGRLTKSSGWLKDLASAIPAWAVLVLIPLCCFVALALHELGHLLAGQRVRFRFLLYIVGPLRIERESSGRLAVRFNRQLATYGGLCASVPTGDQNLLQRFAWIVLGGPLMSLIVGVLGLMLGVFPALPAPLRLCSLFLGCLSLLLCLVTAIPMQNGVFLTDGARWLRLKRGGELAARDVALLQIYAFIIAGKPASEWSEEMVRATLTPQDDSIFEASGQFFAYLYHLERNEHQAAGEYMDRAIRIAEELHSPMMASCFVEAAWFAAWHRSDPQTAKSLLEAIGKQPQGVGEGDMLRARAAIALKTNAIPDGLALLEKAEEHFPQTASNRWARQTISQMRGQATQN